MFVASLHYIIRYVTLKCYIFDRLFYVLRRENPTDRQDTVERRASSVERRHSEWT